VKVAIVLLPNDATSLHQAPGVVIDAEPSTLLQLPPDRLRDEYIAPALEQLALIAGGGL
jgi:hypothetical protein